MKIFSNKNSKPYKEVFISEWVFSFYIGKGIDDTYLHITSDSQLYSARIGGNTVTFGILLSAAENNDRDILHAYITLTSNLSLLVMTDDKLFKQMIKLNNAYTSDIADKGGKLASLVTEEEDAANMAFMRSATEYAQATPEERKKLRQEFRQELAEVIQELDTKKDEQAGR